MHYRTPGSKNGYTKYPGKYQPVGQKAQHIFGARWKARDAMILGPAYYMQSVDEPLSVAMEQQKKQREKALNKLGFSDKVNREVTTLWSKNVDAKSGRSIHEMNAETRRIRGGNLGTSTTISRNRKLSEQRRIAGGNPYIRDELKNMQRKN